MKKVLILTLVLAMSLLLLVSCKEKHEHTYESEWSSDAESHWYNATCEHEVQKGLAAHTFESANMGSDPCKTSPADGPMIWARNYEVCTVCDYSQADPKKTVNVTLIAESETTYVGKLRMHFQKNITGISPKIKGFDTDFAANQIIIGNSGKDISNTAYQKLDRIADVYTLAERGESAFLIYAEGGSLAVVYSDVYSEAASINYIIDNLTDTIYYADGVVAYNVFNIQEFIDSERTANREEGFAKLTDVLNEDAINALRSIYNLYDERLYLWLANLYEPNITYNGNYYGGGFYYSASGRDYDGFLPDLESTGQAFAILDNSGIASALGAVGQWGKGAYWGRDIAERTIYVHNYLPNEIWQQLYTFATSLKAEDGYFYHPQWPSVGTSRLGRDSGWGNSLIAMYNKSTAAKEASAAATVSYAPYVTLRAASALSTRLGGSVASRVAAAMPVAESEFDKALKSQSSWLEYLKKGFDNNSYSIANNLNANTTKIRNAGRWNDTLTFLEQNQKANGLWDDEVNYSSISALMKVSKFWGDERSFPNPEAAIKSCMEIIEADMDDSLTAIVYVYNPWDAMKNILGATSATFKQEMMQYLADNAATLFTKTRDKLAQFKRIDGGFGYGRTTSTPTSQGALVAMDGVIESDVNATSIAITSILNDMLGVFELSSLVPELYYEYDSIYFLEELTSRQPVIKKPVIIADPIKATFDDYDSSSGEEGNGIVKYPSLNSQMNLGNTEIGDDGNYKYIFSQIITSPVETDKYGNVLYVGDLVYDRDGNGKIDDDAIDCPSSGSNTEFQILNYGIVGNTYVLDMDMYCLGSENFYYTKETVKEDGTVEYSTAFNSAPVMQIMFSQFGSSNHSVWVNLVPYEGDDGKIYIRINENFAGDDGVKSENIVRGIPLNEWTNLRIETYKIYDDEGGLTVRAKIFVNGTFVAETDSSHYTNEQYTDFTINSVKLAYYRTNDSAFYLDNVFVYKANTAYESEQVDDSKIDTTVSAPSSYDFETTVTDGITTSIFNANKDASESIDYTTVDDSKRPSDYEYGVYFNIIDDPKNNANKILQANSKDSSNGITGVIELDTPKAEGKRIHIIEYDFYYVTNSQQQDIIQLELLDSAGVKTGGAVTIMRSVSKTEFKLKNATAAEKLAAGKWYKIRIVIDSDAKTINYHFSEDGVKYYVGAQPASISSTATISKINMIVNAYHNTGTFYMDNINYTMASEIPEAEIIVNEMAGVQNPSYKITYNFTDGLIPENDNFKATAIFGGNSYTAGTSEYNTAVAANGKSGDANLLSVAGMQFYVVNDPKNASNKVLQIVSNKVGSSNSTIDIIGSKTGTVGNVLELTFDYYMDYNLYTQANLPIMRVMFWDGQYAPEDVASERRLSVFAQTTSDKKFNFDTSKSEGQETSKMTGGVKFGDYVADSHTWYTIKIIVSGGKQYTYISSNYGASYTLIATASYSANTANMKYARLYFNSYQSTTRQYVDNISYEMKDTFVDPTK